MTATKTTKTVHARTFSKGAGVPQTLVASIYSDGRAVVRIEFAGGYDLPYMVTRTNTIEEAREAWKAAEKSLLARGFSRV